MKMDATWNANFFGNELPHNIKFVTLPEGKSVIIPDYICIGKTTAHPQEAHDFAKWMAHSKEGIMTRLDLDEADDSVSFASIPLILDQEISERFFANYSRVIYPLFLWYAYSAQLATESVFTLSEFRASVRLNYVDIRRNGESTLAWLERNVERRQRALEEDNPEMVAAVEAFGHVIKKKGVESDNCYLYMHGHTLMDNVVMPLLNAVCDKLRQLSVAKIHNSKVEGVALQNELKNYTNTLRSIRDVLLDNENYTSSPLYKRLRADIQEYLDIMIGRIKAERPTPTILRCNFEP
jgi:spermidine/putrescine-binding protein